MLAARKVTGLDSNCQTSANGHVYPYGQPWRSASAGFLICMTVCTQYSHLATPMGSGHTRSSICILSSHKYLSAVVLGCPISYEYLITWHKRFSPIDTFVYSVLLFLVCVYVVPLHRWISSLASFLWLIEDKSDDVYLTTPY